MKLDAGTIITIVAVILFYLRIITIQRARIKRAQYQYAKVSEKNAKKKSGDKKPEINYSRLGIQIKSWWMVAGAILLITFGAVIVATQMFGTSSNLWWIPMVLGIGLFSLAIK